MNKKKIIWLGVAGLLAVAAIFDAIRYLKPGLENKMVVQPVGCFPISNAKEIVLVYNAWGVEWAGGFLMKPTLQDAFMRMERS